MARWGVCWPPVRFTRSTLSSRHQAAETAQRSRNPYSTECEKKDEDARLYVLVFATSEDAKRAAKSLNADVDVEYVHAAEEKQPSSATDPLRNRQWGLAAIELFQAQKLPGFDSARDISVAAIDTGVDAEHPDLEDADVQVFNFTRGGARDRDGHGTHVMGTIAAVINNDVGISGVCQSQRLISLKALAPFNQRGYFRALRHVIDEDVQVLNLSLVGRQTATEEKLIRRAIRNGTIVVCAMGNQGSSQRVFPAAYRNVIAVGASTTSDGPWRKSNRGRHIDLVAPGLAIFSTTPRYRTSRARNRLYDSEGWDGTSMATAFVTGTVALCLAKNPLADLDEVRRALHEGADRVPGQDGFTSRFGWGRLNVRRTLELI